MVYWHDSTCLALAARKQLYLIILVVIACPGPAKISPNIMTILFKGREKGRENDFISTFASLWGTTTVMFISLQHFLFADFPTIHGYNACQNWVPLKFCFSVVSTGFGSLVYIQLTQLLFLGIWFTLIHFQSKAKLL